jgi:hypothetical protein
MKRTIQLSRVALTLIEGENPRFMQNRQLTQRGAEPHCRIVGFSDRWPFSANAAFP